MVCFDDGFFAEVLTAPLPAVSLVDDEVHSSNIKETRYRPLSLSQNFFDTVSVSCVSKPPCSALYVSRQTHTGNHIHSVSQAVAGNQ